MTIDWTLPVETTEDPPRPVRVLCTDGPGDFPVVTITGDQTLAWASSGDRWASLSGWQGGNALTLRNVPPPKPEPVLLEGWVKLYAKYGQWPSASSSVFASEDDARESVTMREPLSICKVAWMSDGSPVPGEDAPLIGMSDAEFRRLCDNVEAPLIAERDQWKAKAEALQDEVDKRNATRESELGCSRCEWVAAADAMRPVVEAAVAWKNAFRLEMQP